MENSLNAIIMALGAVIFCVAVSMTYIQFDYICKGIDMEKDIIYTNNVVSLYGG